MNKYKYLSVVKKTSHCWNCELECDDDDFICEEFCSVCDWGVCEVCGICSPSCAEKNGYEKVDSHEWWARITDDYGDT